MAEGVHHCAKCGEPIWPATDHTCVQLDPARAEDQKILAENTKEVPGPFDAFETAKPGEPIFTLQGGDPAAPRLVLMWAWLARARTGIRGPSWDAIQERMLKSLPEAKGEAEEQELLLRASSAEAIAWDMEAYLAGYAANSDVDAAYEQSRQEGAMTDSGSTEALKSLVRHKTRVRHAAFLSHVVAELQPVIDFCKAEGWLDAEERLSQIAAELEKIERHIQPHRLHGDGTL